MLKLLRRKSFRKSKDLNSESGSRATAGRSGPAYSSGGGQYSVSSVRQRRRNSSGLQSTHSLSQPENNYSSLDRSGSGSGSGQQRQSRDNVRTLRSRYSSLSNTNSEDSPPEILQYARPPENLASPVRESNSYLPESVVTSRQDCETTIQKLFFDSVVNGGKVGDSGERKSSVDQRSRSEARRSVIARETPARRRSSSNNNNNSNNNSGNNNPANNTSTTPSTSPAIPVNQQQSESECKAGRRSVLSVLRQSFRKSKKERPRAAPARPEPRARQEVSVCSLVDDQTSTVSVASVRAGRTLTPSRASIVSKSSLTADRENGGENNNQTSMKTATPSSITRQLGSRPSYTSSSSTSSTATAATGKADPPTATPRHGGTGGQRFLPETPKLVASAVPPIYANVHSSGNNRQMSPGIAKILEDSGNKRAENGVSRTPSSSQVPPSIPKPAARLSIRQKVEFQPLVGGQS